jgi:hypothetical protein
VGVMTKNILNKLALLGLRPGLLSARPYWTQSEQSGYHADSSGRPLLLKTIAASIVKDWRLSYRSAKARVRGVAFC